MPFYSDVIEDTEKNKQQSKTESSEIAQMPLILPDTKEYGKWMDEKNILIF